MNSTRPIQFWKKLIPNFNKILDHGCWCSALLHNKLPNTVPIDQLDQICHNWAVCRRCTKETETACQAGYDKKTSISEVEQYNFQCNALDDCTNSLCRCNMDFVVDISDFFQDYFDIKIDFTPDVLTRQQCGLPKHDEDLYNIHVHDVKQPEIVFGWGGKNLGIKRPDLGRLCPRHTPPNQTEYSLKELPRTIYHRTKIIQKK